MAIGDTSNVKKAEEKKFKTEDEVALKIILRDIAAGGAMVDPNAEDPYQVEDYVTDFLKHGYEIVSAQVVGSKKIGEHGQLVYTYSFILKK